MNVVHFDDIVHAQPRRARLDFDEFLIVKINSVTCQQIFNSI